MKVGQKVFIPELDQFGHVHRVDMEGNPLQLQIKTINPIEPEKIIFKIIDVANMSITVLGLLRQIWALIRSIFKSDSHADQ